MKLSHKGEYALRAMIDLSLHYGQGLIRIADTSQREGIPRKFLEQIFLQLKKAGLLESLRGIHGGYRLAHPPGEITLARVIRIIDGPLAPINCVSTYAPMQCGRKQTCGLHTVMLEVRDAVAMILENKTLEDACKETKRAPCTKNHKERTVMKRMSKIAAMIVVLVACAGIVRPTTAVAQELKGTISLSGAWAVYPTAVAWAEAFQKKNPGVKINVSAGGAGKGVSDVIAGLVDIGMVSRDPDPAELTRGISTVYVLHDAVYPIVSAKNPHLRELTTKGIPKKTWEDIYLAGTISSWDAVTGKKTNKALHVYTRSDSCGAAASWAKFIDKKQEDLKGVGVYADPGILEAVRRDPLGLGYSNFSYVFGRNGKVIEGIILVPIDTNANGKADPNERFRNRTEAVAALDAGTYPVARKNYFFMKGAGSPLTREFIRFCLSSEGTVIVTQVGTSLPVPAKERAQILKQIR